MAKMNLASIEGGRIRLNSGLNEIAFGKTHFSSVENYKGFYFDGNEFHEWAFSDIKSGTEAGADFVYFEGENPLSDKAETLYSVFESENKTVIETSVKKVCLATEIAVKNKIPLSATGSGAIIIESESKDNRILFLPPELFENAASTLESKLFSELYLNWVNESLRDRYALSFMRAAFVYKMLTGCAPFPETNKNTRFEELRDKNFIPVQYYARNLTSSFAANINNALGLRALSEDDEKFAVRKDDYIFPISALDSEDFEVVTASESEKVLGTTADSFKKNQRLALNTRRLFRRNSTLFAVCVCAVIFAFMFGKSIQKSRRGEFTSKGLNSIQTVQCFFKAVNKKDLPFLQNIINGRVPQKYADSVSQIFVTSKNREIYYRDNGIVSMENWLYYVTSAQKDSLSGLYGITNVRIDGVPYELNVKANKIDDNPLPVEKEGDVTVENGMQSVHKVQYYLVHSEGEENNLLVDDIEETFVLVFKKGCWVVTDIINRKVNADINQDSFKNEYFALLEKNGGDVISAVNELRSKYSWLPSEQALIIEKSE